MESKRKANTAAIKNLQAGPGSGVESNVVLFGFDRTAGVPANAI
jgi:hypothetical protein